MIAKGAADKEVARALGISTATAQKHVTNLLKRLNVPNRAAATAVLVSSTSRTLVELPITPREPLIPHCAARTVDPRSAAGAVGPGERGFLAGLT